MHSAYGATKACMESLARTWSVELGHDYGITVNAVNSKKGLLKNDDCTDSMLGEPRSSSDRHVGVCILVLLYFQSAII